MTQKATDSLRAEHAAVLLKLSALESICLHPDRGAETIAQLKDLASFFQKDFWVHFTKEEEALFPEMGRFTLMDVGPIGAMLREHRELRNSNDRLQSAISGYLADMDSVEFMAKMKEQGTHFIWMLRDHINKEDNMLFIMAEKWLDETQKSRVMSLYGEIESAHGTAAK